jgi:hypothetical protein
MLDIQNGALSRRGIIRLGIAGAAASAFPPLPRAWAQAENCGPEAKMLPSPQFSHVLRFIAGQGRIATALIGWNC